MARVRVVGSGYTVWKINNRPILYCIEVSHRSPQTVAQAAEIHPLNYLRPVEILVPRAITHGEIVMNVVETYGKKIWDSFVGDDGNPLFNRQGPGGTGPNLSSNKATDLADIVNEMSSHLTKSDGQSLISLQRLVKTAWSSDTPTVNWILTTYHGVRITDIREDETARTETLQNNLQITVWYTSKTDEEFAVNVQTDDNAAGHLPDELSYNGR